ncbi:methyl-coenzyme M reductase family protein [Methanobacterium petrolearium]|uniref:methyl-coenzyme M reductase family protein n=1 Tax=Methanobacterium petrolearium TaxID=710190 RepID=UPI001AE6A57D|nr:methyl-coenzyme M reductase family protein [Methanobacterium petrolearium]MBP1946212.1 hypothetical protein [Methanobacterium petrolearium]BDZ71282.1 hypothetical protein GCM10025861_17990 [Methanobacterium petrolearium]
MYKILLFSGGVYKYELLVEHVDDVGGLIIQEDVLRISRGTSFLADELRVILIVPSNEISSINSVASDIKGHVEELKLEKPVHENLVDILQIYDILCKTNSWLNIDSVMKLMISDDENGFIETNEDSGKNDTETIQKLEECLDLMLSLKIVDKRTENSESEYCISKD